MSNQLVIAPKKGGLSSKKIIEFIDKMQLNKINLHSFMILRKGEILCEAYYKPVDKNFKHRLYSSSKTVVALAIGMLIDEGKLKLSDKISEFFPEVIEKPLEKWREEITIEDMLKMAVSLDKYRYFDPDFNPVWAFFNRGKIEKPSGTIFNYNSAVSFMLGVLIEKLTGKTVVEYMRPLFDEIGVSKDIWCLKSPDGYSWMASGIVCSLRDFSAIAQFILDKGKVKGKQLISREYMEKMTTSQIPVLHANHQRLDKLGYGYQTWVGEYGFVMSGMCGQMAYGFNDKEFLFVCNGDIECANCVSAYTILYQGVKDLYLSLDTESDDDSVLKEKIANLELDGFVGSASSPLQEQVNGIKYILKHNPMNFKWIKLELGEDKGALVYENARGVKRLEFNFNKYLQTTFPETHYQDKQVRVPANRELNCVNAGGWVTDSIFVIKSHIIDTCVANVYFTISFKGSEVAIQLQPCAEHCLEDYNGFAGGEKE